MDGTTKSLIRFFVGLLLIGAVLAFLQRGRPPARGLAREADAPAVPQDRSAPAVPEPDGKKEDSARMLPVEVVGLDDDLGIVYLKAEGHEKPFLRIYIDPVTTRSIAAALADSVTERPLPHDLFVNVMKELGVRVTGADVVALRSGIFYAVLRLERDGEKMSIDSRPSDAMAIALRVGAPLRIDSRVLDEAGFAFPSEDDVGEEAEPLPGSERDL